MSGIHILKTDTGATYEEREEKARQRYIKNRNKTLYKNLVKFLRSASKATCEVDYDEEYNQLGHVLYGVQRRMGELNQKGVGLPSNSEVKK